MPPPHQQGLPPSFAYRAPVEIIYLIAELGSPEVRLSLTYCDKTLHRICYPLVFRDIYFYTPKQLVKLCNSKKAMGMLDRAKEISLCAQIFYSEAWAGIEQPTDYLLCVLEATVSLHRLEILGKNGSRTRMNRADFSLRKKFARAIYDRLLDSTFLPKLAVFVEAAFSYLSGVRYTRPVAFHSIVNRGHSSITADIFPALYPPPSITHPLSLAQLASCSYLDLSATDIGLFLREAAAVFPPFRLTCLSLRVGFANEVMNNKPSPLHNMVSWVQDLLSAGGFRLEPVELRIIFYPPLADQSLSAQQEAAIELHRTFPTLECICIPSTGITWCRRLSEAIVGPRSPSYQDPFAWVPSPHSQFRQKISVWWLNALGLDISKTQGDRKLRDVAFELREDMLARSWARDHKFILSEEELFADICEELRGRASGENQL